MVRMLSAWSVSLLVWLLGFAIVARVVSPPEGDEAVSGLDRLVRIDLPWVLISLTMVVVAGAVQRDRTKLPRWLAAVLTIPLLFTAAGVAAPLNGQSGVLAFVLYVAEGVAGAAIGLVVAVVIGGKDEDGGGYW